MAIDGLVKKVRNVISSVGKYAKYSSFCGGLGLASLLPYNADAQTLGLGMSITDFQGNQISSDNLQIRHFYLLNLNVTELSINAPASVSLIKETLKINYDNGATSAGGNITYAGLFTGNLTNGEGAPNFADKDIFQNAIKNGTAVPPGDSGSSTYFNSYSFINGSSGSFQFSRAVNSDIPSLSYGTTKDVASFLFVPLTDGTVTFSYDDSSSGIVIKDFFQVPYSPEQIQLGSASFNMGNYSPSIPELKTFSLILGAAALFSAYCLRRKNASI